MNHLKQDQPAFPSEESREWPGLTKREYFAAMVIQGKNGNPVEIADHALAVADELLKQLEVSD